MERDKTALIIMLTTDLALVFIMFLGLFRLRGRGGGMFGLGRLLWKQVRWCLWWSWFRVSQSLNGVPVHKGVFWLLFAAGAGLIGVASIVSRVVLCPSLTDTVYRRCFFV
jgi:hypothetical protein